METPEIGDKVRVKSVFMCNEEGFAHGYNPLVAGRIGIIIASASHVLPPPGHPWRVKFSGGTNKLVTRPNWQYFAAAELELLEGGSDDNDSQPR